MYYIGAYIAIADPANNPTTKLSSGGISAIAFFYLWTCFYGPTWNGTPWVFGAEVMPTFVRSATQAIIAASNWIFAVSPHQDMDSCAKLNFFHLPSSSSSHDSRRRCLHVSFFRGFFRKVIF